MLMTGTFSRVWGAHHEAGGLFTKLMLVDFGWNEIPHLFPIGALAAITFSNRLHVGARPSIEAPRRARRAATGRTSEAGSHHRRGLRSRSRSWPSFPILFALHASSTAAKPALDRERSDALRHRREQLAVSIALAWAAAPHRLRPAREPESVRDLLGGVQGELDASRPSSRRGIALRGVRLSRCRTSAAPRCFEEMRAGAEAAHVARPGASLARPNRSPRRGRGRGRDRADRGDRAPGRVRHRRPHQGRLRRAGPRARGHRSRSRQDRGVGHRPLPARGRGTAPLLRRLLARGRRAARTAAAKRDAGTLARQHDARPRNEDGRDLRAPQRGGRSRRGDDGARGLMALPPTRSAILTGPES